MSNVDRVFHFIGMAAAGVVVTGATGGAAIPAWLTVVCGIVAYASGAAATPGAGKLGPLTGLFGGAKGQKADAEDPK